MADDGDQLLEGFINFVKLSAAGKTLTNEQTCQMNAKAAGKMARDLMDKGVSERVDSSVFPVFKEKGKNYIQLNKITCEEFIKKCAHEQCKIKSPTIKADDQKVKDKAVDIRAKIISTAPKKNATGTSKTGNVSALTDASKYTGSHKERFDAEGKGKGKEGRENVHENTGYVGQYKGKDTFDKKH